jgi:opine dehydrogenase
VNAFENRPIAVLGAGSGGHCMAADLTLAGHSVILAELPEFANHLHLVCETRTIRLTGIGGPRNASVTDVTFDIAHALERADLLNVVVPAFGQRRFFDEILPHLEPRHTLAIWAGDFGSLEFRSLLAEQRPDLRLGVVETNTLPYGARLIEPGEAHVSVMATKVLAAELPNGPDQGAAVSRLQELWPSVTAWPDVVSVALCNPNPIVHPPGTLLNVGRIQYSRGDFNLYREGITEAVARIIRRVYEEVHDIADVLGADVLEYEDRDFRTKTSIMGVTFQAAFDTDQVIGDIPGPKSIHDRYITEDLPFGLVPIAELGDRVDVETPVIDSLVSLGCAVCNTDFWSEGRGLERLGLGQLSAAEIMAGVRASDPELTHVELA